MDICPHCGHGLQAGQSHCPNCGEDVPADWPPTPSGQPDAPVPPVGKLITGTKNGDFVLGLVLSVISIFVIVGWFVAPIMYGLLLNTYPSLASGIGWGWLLVLLGAFAVCFGPSFCSRQGGL